MLTKKEFLKKQINSQKQDSKFEKGGKKKWS